MEECFGVRDSESVYVSIGTGYVSECQCVKHERVYVLVFQCGTQRVCDTGVWGIRCDVSTSTPLLRVRGTTRGLRFFLGGL